MSKKLICDQCGKQDETVEETIDPYCWEIDEEIVDRTLCENCLNERAEEI